MLNISIAYCGDGNAMSLLRSEEGVKEIESIWKKETNLPCSHVELHDELTFLYAVRVILVVRLVTENYHSKALYFVKRRRRSRENHRQIVGSLVFSFTSTAHTPSRIRKER